MRRHFVSSAAPVLMLFALFALWAPLASGTAGQLPRASENLAKQSAKQWLALVDGGNYARSWEASSQYLKSSVSKDKWVQDLSGARRPIGVLRSRAVASIEFKKGLPNNPGAEYVVAVYHSAFAKAPSTSETLFLMRDNDGRWRVAGYLVKPRQ